MAAYVLTSTDIAIASSEEEPNDPSVTVLFGMSATLFFTKASARRQLVTMMVTLHRAMSPAFLVLRPCLFHSGPFVRAGLFHIFSALLIGGIARLIRQDGLDAV